MTDLDAFIALYTRFGIECKVWVNPKDKDGNQHITMAQSGNIEDPAITRSDKFEGYIGFYTEIKFTRDGEFISQAFLE